MAIGHSIVPDSSSDSRFGLHQFEKLADSERFPNDVAVKAKTERV
jgi:hypothetical protein